VLPIPALATTVPVFAIHRRSGYRGAATRRLLAALTGTERMAGSMDDIRIITLPVERWAEYRALRLFSLQESPHAFGSAYADNVTHPDEFWINRLQTADEGRNLLLFAEEAGRLVGMIGTYEDATEPGVVNIISVFVAPDYRGRGLSSRLVDAILTEVRHRPDIRAARLTVNISQTAAISAYNRAGFVTVATERNPMGDGNVYDELIMELNLHTHDRG
jgi:ribosomal protein S18 acetylase RimI-like enzyme